MKIADFYTSYTTNYYKGVSLMRYRCTWCGCDADFFGHTYNHCPVKLIDEGNYVAFINKMFVLPLSGRIHCEWCVVDWNKCKCSVSLLKQFVRDMQNYVLTVDLGRSILIATEQTGGKKCPH